MPKSQTVHALTAKPQKNGHDKWTATMLTERGNAISWTDAGAEDLLAAVAAVTEDGAALLLSRTSDGGALAIHVLADGNTHKLYPANVAELNEALAMITSIALQH